MAVTSIWAVQERLDNVLKYIENPDKTTESPELTPEAIAARKAVGDVIDYAENADKTEQMMYVTGINCSAKDAAHDFMDTKVSWRKTGGRLAYHGYQAFKEGDGEITAEQAHEIGIKLAREIWGDRFEVVVATHLNTGHYHNHFVINSVSFLDGLKYRRTKADYAHFRATSDRLCREAKLHVVEHPSIRKRKSYDEWLSEKEGRYTVRGRIREDIDQAISMSCSEKQFAKILKDMGYEFKFFKQDGSYLEHPGLKPPGAKSFFRFSGLGPDYDFDSIRRRIIQNTLVPGTPLLVERKSFRKWNGTPIPGLKGLPGTYQRYCIRLYSYSRRPIKKEYIPMSVREDIAKLNHYIEILDFLCEHKLETSESLAAKRTAMKHEIGDLTIKRKKMYSEKKRAERAHDTSGIASAKSGIRSISMRIKELQKQVDLCDAVTSSTGRVQEGVNAPTQKPEIEQPKPQIKHKHRS